LLGVLTAVMAADTDTDSDPTATATAGTGSASTDGDGNSMNGRVCDKGMVEVGDGMCCPRNKSFYFDGQCYPQCDVDHDNFVLGSFVGCRNHCDAEYSTNVNECVRNIHVVPRVDSPLSGVPASKQRASPYGGKECPKKHIRVPLNEDGTGGCCPVDQSYWINGKCYSTCADGDHTDAREILILGQMVACRSHCSADATSETTNQCMHADGEDPTDRLDFPRVHHHAVDRRHAPKVVAPQKSNGCRAGWVRTSNLRCCPGDSPNLIGLLCYENCPEGWESRDFGCHKHCKPGWTELRHTCERDGFPTKTRKTFERNPVLPKFRLL